MKFIYIVLIHLLLLLPLAFQMENNLSLQKIKLHLQNHPKLHTLIQTKVKPTITSNFCTTWILSPIQHLPQLFRQLFSAIIARILCRSRYSFYLLLLGPATGKRYHGRCWRWLYKCQMLAGDNSRCFATL